MDQRTHAPTPSGQDLVTGQKYRITYKAPNWKYARTAVMTYLGPGSSDGCWNARPFAGTQDLPDSWVQTVEKVDNDTEPYMNRRA
jgi:hypothetical protein